MNIISWDIGIKNLAYVILKEDKTKCIYEWNLINLTPNKAKCYYKKCKQTVIKYCTIDNTKLYCCDKHSKIIVSNNFKDYKYNFKIDINNLKQLLIKYLDLNILPLIYLYNVNYILIENQPCLKNPKMKSIADTIYTWSLIRCCIDSNICNKVYYINASNKLYNIPGLSSYYNKKCKSVSIVLEYLSKNSTSLLKYLNTFEKKDDLCDALLQALYWINNFNKYKKQ